MMWTEADLTLFFEDDGSPDNVLIMDVGTPIGSILIMGEAEAVDGTVMLRGVHIQGVGFGANTVGIRNLRLIAEVVLERMGNDEVVIEGAGRTSGANPKRRPDTIRFARRRRPASSVELPEP